MTQTQALWWLTSRLPRAQTRFGGQASLSSLYLPLSLSLSLSLSDRQRRVLRTETPTTHLHRIIWLVPYLVILRTCSMLRASCVRMGAYQRRGLAASKVHQ